MSKKQSPKSSGLSGIEETQSDKESGDKNSIFKFLWCYLRFTSEPLWYRLTVIIIIVAAILLIIWFLKEWVPTAHLIGRLSSLKLSWIVNHFKKG